MSNKTIALIVFGFIVVFLGGLIIGALAIKAFFPSSPKVKLDEYYEKDKIILTRGSSTGEVVLEILDGSPAELAGLEEGDVIYSVDGEDISSFASLGDLIRSNDVGDDVELLIVRGKDKRSINVSLGEHPDDEQRAYLGVVAQPLKRGPLEQIRPGDRFAYPHYGHMDDFMPFHHPGSGFRGMGSPGLIIMHVAEGSPAEESGLLTGDIVHVVDGEEITDFEQFAGIIGTYEPEDEITLNVFRGNDETEFKITLGEHPEDASRAYLGVMGMGTHQLMPEELHPRFEYESQG